MIRAVHHAGISTGDLDRTVAFYRDLLGFQVINEWGWEAGGPLDQIARNVTELENSAARVAMLKLGDFKLEFFEFKSPVPRPGDPRRPVSDHGITHVCLDVTDVDAEYERLKAAGMRFHGPPQDLGLGVKATYGRDPDGNVVELQQMPAWHPALTRSGYLVGRVWDRLRGLIGLPSKRLTSADSG